jgi:hypothetical protein
MTRSPSSPDKWDEVQKGFNLKGSVPSEHERDAVLAFQHERA